MLNAQDISYESRNDIVCCVWVIIGSELGDDFLDFDHVLCIQTLYSILDLNLPLGPGSYSLSNLYPVKYRFIVQIRDFIIKLSQPRSNETMLMFTKCSLAVK